MNPPLPTKKTVESDAIHTSTSVNGTVPAPRGEVFEGFTGNDNPGPFQMTKNKKIGWLFTGITVAFFLLLLNNYINGRTKAPEPIGPFAAADSVRPSLKVQVAGQVKNPGVYELPGGSRIQDAIEAAGGALPDADINSLKLADWATDGSRIDVPAVGVAPAGMAPAPPAPASPSNLAPVPSNSVLAPSNFAPAPTAAMVIPTLAPTADPTIPVQVNNVYLEYLRKNPINLNRATAAQIEALPDVGPKMAEHIVAYRDANGPFQRIEDLDNVKGFGEKRISELKDLVTLQ